MFCVYWVQDFGDGDERPCASVVEDLKEALALTERCRNFGFRFVTMASEVPGNVTKMGVDTTGPDYEWFKRRDSLRVGRREFLESLKKTS